MTDTHKCIEKKEKTGENSVNINMCGGMCVLTVTEKNVCVVICGVFHTI